MVLIVCHKWIITLMISQKVFAKTWYFIEMYNMYASILDNKRFNIKYPSTMRRFEPVKYRYMLEKR